MTFKKHTGQLVIVAFICVFLMITVIAAVRTDLANDILTNVYVGCEDSNIVVSWKLPAFNRASGVLVNIEGNGVSEELLVSPLKNSYKFTDGVHGDKYTVIVREIYKNGTEGESVTKEVLFFDEDKIPDIPVLRIETVNHEEPHSQSTEPQDDVWGETVTDNEYVEGVMKYTVDSSTQIDKRISIRVRGNTSSTGPKKSYKITMSKPVDMLRMGEEYASKEWLLIDQGESMNAYIGEYLSEYCGMEWTVHMKIVNVIINGDWKGMYYLSENPKDARSAGHITKNGFMVENDPYWWKADNVYFDIDEQQVPMKMTFVYPDINSADDERIGPVRDYMQFVHNKIYNEDDEALYYIDTDSFVSWIMVKDLMLVMDGGGSNIYYYVESLDPSDYQNSKIYIGPVWDLDSGMKASEKEADPDSYWGSQHTTGWFIYCHLFNLPEFRNAYQNRWNGISSGLANDLGQELENYYTEHGEAIEASRVLEAARWDKEVVTLREEIDYDKAFMDKRIAFIDSETGDW